MTAKAKQVRLPKVEYLCRLVDEMTKRGAYKVTFGDFNVEIHPNFHPTEPTSLDDSPKSEAKAAVKEAMEKVKRANQTEDEDLFWST